MKKEVEFEIKPLNTRDNYFGFELEKPLHKSANGIIMHNSGKSVMEQAIVGHVSRFSDRFQLVGVDCKRVEFNLLRGVKGVKGVALDVPTAAAAVDNFREQMMRRFKFMEDMKVNNIFKIKNKEVDYYEVFGKTYQFDEMFELTVDLDKSDTRNYEKLKRIYITGRQPLIITIEEIYQGMQEGRWKGRHPQLPVVKGYNTYLNAETITKTKGIFVPKLLIFLADEMNELMNSDDFKSVDTVKQCLGSIARLGRAAAVHLALACQRASGSTISSDLKNNIQLCCLLGGFDDGASTLMFEKDISNLAKPDIKGRGFIKSGNDIIETQTYFTKPENDWEFDTDQLLTFQNPEFEKQCKVREIDMDALNTGWVDQVPYDEGPVEEEDEEDDDDMMRPRGGFFDDEDDFFQGGAKKRMSPRKPPKTEKPVKPEKKEPQPEISFTFGDDKEKEPEVKEPNSPMEYKPIVAPIVEPITETADAVEETPPAPKFKLKIDPNKNKPNQLKFNLKTKGSTDKKEA